MKALCPVSHSLAYLLLIIAGSCLPLAARADIPEYYYDDQYNRHEYRAPDFRYRLRSPYLMDPVNRRSSLTPEPVWRSMFPSIRERIAIESRHFGVGGEAERELRYWRSVPE